MTQRLKEQVAGFVIMAAGIGLTVFNWHIALNEQQYYSRTAGIGPAFAVLGLGLLLFPGYRTERLARGEDLSNLSGLRLLTPRWWIVLVAALALGLLNWYLMARLYS